MKLPLRLALRDLRGGLSGLGLLWLCLAVAIAGLASVTSLASSVDRAIAANGRQLLGGDLMLSVAQREANAEERAAIDALGRSSKSITTRAMLVTSGRPQPAGRAVGRRLPAGRWPARSNGPARASVPSGAEVAIGREIAERLAVGLGDRRPDRPRQLSRIGDHRQNAARLRLRAGPAGADGRGRAGGRAG